MRIAALFISFVIALTGCQPPQRPDELELMSKDVLKSKRGIRIDIEPGDEESQSSSK